MLREISRFIKGTVVAAIATPFAPLGIIYYCTHEVYACGNGADAWGTFGIGMAGFLGSLSLAVCVVGFLINPILGAILYGIWCLMFGVASAR